MLESKIHDQMDIELFQLKCNEEKKKTLQSEENKLGSF